MEERFRSKTSGPVGLAYYWRYHLTRLGPVHPVHSLHQNDSQTVVNVFCCVRLTPSEPWTLQVQTPNTHLLESRNVTKHLLSAVCCMLARHHPRTPITLANGPRGKEKQWHCPGEGERTSNREPLSYLPFRMQALKKPGTRVSGVGPQVPLRLFYAENATSSPRRSTFSRKRNAFCMCCISFA